MKQAASDHARYTNGLGLCYTAACGTRPQSPAVYEQQVYKKSLDTMMHGCGSENKGKRCRDEVVTMATPDQPAKAAVQTYRRRPRKPVKVVSHFTISSYEDEEEKPLRGTRKASKGLGTLLQAMKEPADEEIHQSKKQKRHTKHAQGHMDVPVRRASSEGSDATVTNAAVCGIPVSTEANKRATWAPPHLGYAMPRSSNHHLAHTASMISSHS